MSQQFGPKNARRPLPNEMMAEMIAFLANYPHLLRSQGKAAIGLNSAFSALYAKQAQKLMGKFEWSQNWKPIYFGPARLAIASRSFDAQKQRQIQHAPEELMNFNCGDLLLIYGKVEGDYFLGEFKDAGRGIRRLIPVDFVRLVKRKEELEICQAKYAMLLGI